MRSFRLRRGRLVVILSSNLYLFTCMAGHKSRGKKLFELNENNHLRSTFIKSLTQGSFLSLGATLVRQSDDFSTQTMSR